MTSTVFCLDFDETLMNTDRLRADLETAITRLGGESLLATYQEAYESVRREQGGVSIPMALRALSGKTEIQVQLAEIFHTFPYQDYLYPGTEEVIMHLKKQGSVLILSDGDAFFQPQKIYATSLARYVDSVIVLPSKVDRFDELASYYPAEHYVFIDDKQKVLDAAKKHFGGKVTTVLAIQGRYATTADPLAADLSVKNIADVVSLFPLS